VARLSYEEPAERAKGAAAAAGRGAAQRVVMTGDGDLDDAAAAAPDGVPTLLVGLRPATPPTAPERAPPVVEGQPAIPDQHCFLLLLLLLLLCLLPRASSLFFWGYWVYAFIMSFMFFVYLSFYVTKWVRRSDNMAALG
jgi:hypothetical protein